MKDKSSNDSNHLKETWNCIGLIIQGVDWGTQTKVSNFKYFN